MQPSSRSLALLTLMLMLSLLPVFLPREARATAPYPARCFDIPGITNCLEGRFRQFWEDNGGIAVFGYPLTPAGMVPTSEGSFLTQYFERTRFEYHADRQPPYDVQLGRLGDERLRMQGIDWHDLPPVAEATPQYFEATGHAIHHSPFWDYWSTHGLHDQNMSAFDRSLALFGMPLTEPYMDTNASGDTVLTQWFERARFEDHGDQGVLLGLLGREMEPFPPLAPAPVPPALPDPTPEPGPPQGDKVVYLTFDDGPSGQSTAQVLAILRRYRARATFFVIGRQVPGGLNLIREAASDGHTFGNHTYTHRTLVNLSRDTFSSEVLTTQAVLGTYATSCLRPPGGSIDAADRAYAADLGLRVVLWDIDPRDWERPGADVIAERVLDQVRPGTVVLLHDGGGDRTQTAEALDTILHRLSEQGYRFEPLC